MTREETISILEESKRQNEIMRDNPSTFWASHQMADGVKNAERRIAALDLALSALRPVSREWVEKVCGGCEKCNGAGEYSRYAENLTKTLLAKYCPHCGRPLTDEAVEMVMERMEALHENRD